MTTYSLPVGMVPSGMVWGLDRKVVASTSSLSAYMQSVDLYSWRWVVDLSFAPTSVKSVAAAREAFFNTLVGGADRLQMHRLDRPQPLGTMRGTPTLSASAAQFAPSISIQTTAAATLKAGDFIGVGGQLLQVRLDAAANGSGVMVVYLVNRLRASLASGAAVTWSKPTAVFAVQDAASAFGVMPGRMDGVMFRLVEAPV